MTAKWSVLSNESGLTNSFFTKDVTMLKRFISPVATVIGVLLLALSFAWPSLIDENKIWSTEQELERGDAIAELHRQSNHSSSERALQQAKERVARSNAALSQARNRHDRTILILKWSGIFLVGVGAIALLVTRNSDP